MNSHLRTYCDTTSRFIILRINDILHRKWICIFKRKYKKSSPLEKWEKRSEVKMQEMVGKGICLKNKRIEWN